MAMFVVIRARGPAWDESKPMRAQWDWDEHARFMEQLVADGVVLLGGPTSDDNKVLLIVDAIDEEAVRERLAHDSWHKAGLLLIERVARWEVLLDFRQPGLTLKADH